MSRSFSPSVPTLNKNDDLDSGAIRATTLELQQMEKTPLFSVITPTYNGAQYLGSQIESVLAQTCQDFEHIVIDDGSSDNDATVQVLRQYPHLRWWSRTNRGQSATMNEGLEAAEGTWVLFLCADDLLAGPDVLSRVAGSIREKPAAEVHYGPWRIIDTEGRLRPERAFCAPLPSSWFRYVFACSHCAMYVRRERLLEHSIRFDPTVRWAGDVDWILQLVGAGLRFRFVNQVLAHYRVHATQASRNQSEEWKPELRRILARHHVSPTLRALANRVLGLRMAALRRLGRAGQ